MDFKKVLKVSLLGAFLSQLILVVSLYGFTILHEPFSFSLLVILWLLSFVLVGALEMRLLFGSQELFSTVFISDILTSVWVIFGTFLILSVRYFYRTGGIDLELFAGILSVFSIFAILAPPVMLISIIIGSIGYYIIKISDGNKKNE